MENNCRVKKLVKKINLESLLQANKSLEEEVFDKFLKHYGVDLKSTEIEELGELVEALRNSGCNIRNLNGFFVSYKIPQIGKEFDLLRFGENRIINIEIKRSASIEKIKDQLIRNEYYLSFLDRDICTFTFVSESKELYFLNKDKDLEKKEFRCLTDLIASQALDRTDQLAPLFDPSNFLVSPFNSTDNFLAGKYFLTHQQEEIKHKIMGKIDLPGEAKFISIMGNAGTGKTLLTYDIARDFIKRGEKPLIVHCGILNDGHELLKNNGWEITPISSYELCKFDDYDLIVVDEAQRLYQCQLDEITKRISLTKHSCIFSHDKHQILSSKEKNSDACARILAIDSITRFELTEKIRTNKEIASFIQMLFDKKKPISLSNNSNIEINYFNSIQDAKHYLEALNETLWTVLRFTPSLFDPGEHHNKYSNDSNSTSHKVIGQEFDGVAITIDEFFTYANDGNLNYEAQTYYDMPKMLLQNITRARKKLNLVIINNKELLDRCLSILQ